MDDIRLFIGITLMTALMATVIGLGTYMCLTLFYFLIAYPTGNHTEVFNAFLPGVGLWALVIMFLIYEAKREQA